MREAEGRELFEIPFDVRRGRAQNVNSVELLNATPHPDCAWG